MYIYIYSCLVSSCINILKDKVEIPRIRISKRQPIETLINQEALLLEISER